MLSFVMNNGIFFTNVFFTDHFFIDIIHLYLRKWRCILYLVKTNDKSKNISL